MREPYELLALVGLGLAISTCAALGALIVAGRPRHRLGLALLIGGAVSAVWLFVTAWADVPAGSDRPLVQWAAWLDNWIFVGLIVLVTWPLLLFPDGALPSRRWRPIGALLFVATAAVGLAGMLDPGTLSNVDDVQNPLGIPESWTWVTLLEGFGIVIPMGVVAGMLAVQRQARARPGPGMRAALWASRALAANFVLVLALDPEGPVYAATLTASIAPVRGRRDGCRAARPGHRGRHRVAPRVHRRRRGRGQPGHLPRGFRRGDRTRRLVGGRAGRWARRGARRGAAARARQRPGGQLALRSP